MASKKAISIISKTDAEGKGKSAFAKKDQVVLCHPDLNPEEEEATMQWLMGRICWTCNKGLKDAQSRTCNQDCLSILVVEDDFALYGVYDGHGPNGHRVSEFSCRMLPKLFLQFLHGSEESSSLSSNVESAFKGAFLGTQKLIEEQSDQAVRGSGGDDIDASMSGTTCTMAYHSLKDDKLWVAHVGDSRSIIGSADAKLHGAITIDHKPDVEAERRRIESSNPPGCVKFDGFYNHRVYAKDRHYPALNMSRALGDVIGHREAGLSADPDVKELALSSIVKDNLLDSPEDWKDGDILGGDKVLLLCTDGVWEFIENNDALKMALDKSIDGLAKSGFDKWMEDSGDTISDDITGIMVMMPTEARGEVDVR